MSSLGVFSRYLVVVVLKLVPGTPLAPLSTIIPVHCLRNPQIPVEPACCHMATQDTGNVF